jgi:hypothetical protein
MIVWQHLGGHASAGYKSEVAESSFICNIGNDYQTAQHHIRDDRNLHIICRHHTEEM